MADMGLSHTEVAAITAGWALTRDGLARTLARHKAFSWQDLQDSDWFGRGYSKGLAGSKHSCAAFLRKNCGKRNGTAAGAPALPPLIQTVPLLYQFSGTDHTTDGFKNFPLVAVTQDIAMFLVSEHKHTSP
jgi:hypothetical protein